jgi:hypothetical protein
VVTRNRNAYDCPPGLTSPFCLTTLSPIEGAAESLEAHD